MNFVYSRRVAFHETDSMGVVHHSNHVKFFEEARVAWLRDRGLVDLHIPNGPLVFAVVDLRCQYRKPARFEDLLEVRVQGRLEGAKILFDYEIWLERIKEVVATGTTTLVPLNEQLRPTRLPERARAAFS